MYDRWLKRFPRSKNLAADIDTIENRFAAQAYGGPHGYYRTASRLSQIVLGTRGIGLNEATSIQGDAVLLNTADSFEKYLRNVITEAYSEGGYVVSKGGLSITTLYTNGSVALIPDIVVARNGRTLLIADA